MDQTYEDEFPRVPGLRIDNDKALSDAVRDFDAMTDEAHEADLETMMRNRAAMESAVIGEGAEHAVLEPDEEVFKKFDPKNIESNSQQAAAQAPEPTPGAAAPQATAEATTPGAAKDAGQATPDATAPANKELVKPHSVDEALAAIRLRDNSHQRRFVVVGDQNIKRAFYDYLEQNGKLKYHNGTPVIGMSQKKTLTMLQEFVSREYAGSSVNHALHMTARREGMGLGVVTAGIKNALGSRSTVDVIVVGDHAVQTEKLKELGDTLGRLQSDNKLTARGDGAKLSIKDGKLELPVDQRGNRSANDQARVGLATENGSAPAKTRPVILEASVGLSSLLLRSKDLVNTWQAEVQRLKDERNEPKPPKNENEKDAATAPEKVNDLASKNAVRLNEAFAKPASLGEPGEHGQSLATALMRAGTKLNDPLVKEVGTLPTETRQQMLVQLAGLATKLDDREFGDEGRKAMDTPHKVAANAPEAAQGDVRSPREKLTDWLAAEAAADPQFADKAKALTLALVEQKALTQEQADRVNQMVAQASAQKETSAEQAAPQAGAQSDASQATAGQDAAATTATATENVKATPEASAVAEQSAAGSADGPTVAPATIDAEPAPATARADAAASTVDGATFGDRLATVTKDGYEAVTERDARAVISELEVLAERRAPLADLARREEMGDPQGATRSLAQVRGLLLSASMGQFGDELATRATALHEAVRDWTNESKASLVAVPDASLSNEASRSAAAAASTQVADNAAPERVQGNAPGVPEMSDRASDDSFSARLTHALKDTEGGSGLTTEQARSIISELESRQGQSLATLGEGEGRSIYPGGSRTLEQVKLVLLSASLGQYGDDLTKRAEALAPAVREWSAQESDRMAVVKDELRATRNRDDVVTATPVSPPQVEAPVQRSAEPAATASTRESTAKESSAAAPTNDAAVLAKEAAPNAGVRMARMQAGSGADAEQQSTRSPGQQTAAGASATPVAAEAKAAAASTRGSEHVHAGGSLRGNQPGAVSQQTKDHAATLYKLMANPAGTFTRRDKSWNLSNIGKVAQAIAGLDLKETAKLPSSERSTLAAYAVWMADSANAGKLPGFSSPGGKQLAAQVTEKAVGLTEQVDAQLPASTKTEMAKAERMVDAKLKHDVKLEQTAQAASSSTTGRAAGLDSSGNKNVHGLARDLVHHVYKAGELEESYANYLLKSAVKFTPESLRGLDPETKARTVAALSFLAGEIRTGAMGEFEQLSKGVRDNVDAATEVSQKLYDHISREPGMAVTLTRAHIELTGRGAAALAETETSTATKTEALTASEGKPPAAKPESDLQDSGAARGGSSRSRGFDMDR